MKKSVKNNKKHKKSTSNNKEKNVAKKISISPELMEKLQYIRICNPCSAFEKITGGKRHSLPMWKKKKCPLCGSRTRRYKMPDEIKAEAAALESKMGGNTGTKAQMEIAEMIMKRARDFDCPGTVVDIIQGPIVTEYKLVPDQYTRVRKLKTLDEDLALALKVENISIKRIPGEAVMGIQIPNAERAPVTFESSLPTVIAHKDDMELPLNFGIRSDGSPYIEDLASFPHLLIGGSTGSGKSVLISQLLCSLMMVRSPRQVQFVMIDPKQVELFPYTEIPHQYRAPVHNVWQVIGVLEDIIKLMRSRTEHLRDYKVHTIKEYNALFKGEAEDRKKHGDLVGMQHKLDMMWPYVVIVIDEMAEIVLENKKDFINRLATLASMARATGISLIAATQRPSVDVLPGKVKVNFMARASLKVPTSTDSKTILSNNKGAESLLNQGDMFMISPNQTGLQRVHVAHCKREDRTQIIKRAIAFPDYKDGLLPDFSKKS